MLSYLKQTQAKLVVIILFDLIILALLTIPLIVTDMPTIIYTENWNLNSHPILYSYHSIYQILIKVQYPLVLALIIYLFSGKRYSQMIKVLGKNKVIITQAIFFILALPLGFIIQTGSNMLLLDSYYMWLAPYIIWLIALGGILIYHLIFFTNIGKFNYLAQCVIYFTVGITGYILYALTVTTTRYYYFSSFNGVNDQIANMTYLGQLSLNTINIDASIVFSYTLVFFAVAFTTLIEHKKVGRL
ncbi:hypothetical protein R2F61_03540 [Mollicutes bacterium LVI A0078]|nr:hypothetical protein RZE84_03570 [Mollicutes bacterium LVI A0075]WOO91636.1 hypothetical protein R2F61_03540 [Mollicutes bacterium LVI A0078]